MAIWTHFVDLLYSTLFGVSILFGGNMGVAIAVVSLTFRLALLPFTVRLAYRSLEMQAVLKSIEPELAKIRSKYKDNPQRMWAETAKMHRQHGIRVIEGRSLIAMLVQLPLFLGLFGAVRRGLSSTGRFLWIKNLMAPDPLLAAICAILTGLSGVLGSHYVSQQQRYMSMVLPAILTFLFLWRISAGVTIYTFSSSVVGLVQSALVRRHLEKKDK